MTAQTMTTGMTDRDIADLDAKDGLAGFRDQFALPDGVIYLDGNSLGARPRRAAARIAEAVESEWGNGLITSWLGADWVNAPQRIGDKIARLIGAGPSEVIACDSTSVNIFKTLCAALSLNSSRSVILSEKTNFPTDVYMMQGIEAFTGKAVRAVTVDPDALVDAIDDQVAVVLLTQVHYKSGRIRDMAEVTRKAHDKGALIVWDLSHSAGAIPVDLNTSNADFAVGCGYKFLNGGPGAPAFLFAASRHHGAALPVLSGWFGHRAPFDFTEDYQPSDGIARFLCGTPPVLGLTALECGIDLFLEADMAMVRAKSQALGALFMERMAPLVAEYGFALVSPADPAIRGSQVSYAHEQGYAIMQALKARGVIGDFRAPDVLRFGLTPLYLSHADIARAVEILADVMASRAWDRPEFRERAAVT
ncbi:MAG: kynureninase [Blastomonas sp.]